MRQRFVIACGGTGGHLAPGIAVAEELQERGHKCTLVLSRKAIDQRLSSKYPHLNFVSAPGRPATGGPVQMGLFLASQLGALRFGATLMRQEQPRAVLAFGGFTSAGVVLAARLTGTPVALHEANRKPGRAVRVLRRLASRIYLPDNVTLPGVPMSRIRYHGFPVRKEMRRINRDDARAALGFGKRQKLLVVLGGSQGAQSLNEWTRKHAKELCESGVNILCVTGPGKGNDETLVFNDAQGRETKAGFISFCDQMPELLSAADLAVARAGAGTIAEFTEMGLPSILIPYPHAADNHQFANAEMLELQGGCVMVEQSHLDSLLDEVRDVLFSDWLLNRLSYNLRALRKSDSAVRIADDLENLPLKPRRLFAPERAFTREATQA